MDVRITLLGGLRVSVDQIEAPLIGRRRVTALVGYLGVHARQRCARDTIVAALWPDAAPDAGRHNLRQTLARLRQALAGAAFVRADRDCLWLEPGVAIDIDEFEDALRRGDFGRAESLWRGPLLPELTDDWAHDARERLAGRRASRLSSSPSPGTPARASRLPRFLAPFIGRAAECAALVERVNGGDRDDAGRLLTLIGPGGIGKTRLAVAVARQIAIPAYFVDLSALSPGASHDEIWKCALDAALPATGSDQSPRDALIGRLAGARQLLLLDNAEHIRESLGPLAAALLHAQPRCQLLITSREALNLRGEQIVSVGALSGDDAVALFRERATSSGASVAEPDHAVAELCAGLDNLPLAIEFAAARARYFSLGELAARLQDRTALTATDSGDRPERHRSVAAALSGSIALLNQDERLALARLSVFVGGWTLESAAAVCETPIESLLGLIDQSLAVRDRPEPGQIARFRLLQIVRQDAVRRLTEEGETQQMAQRHASHFLALAEKLAPALRSAGQDAALRQLHDEHANLRAAWTALDTLGRQRLAIALGRFFQVHGVAREWEPRIAAAVHADDAADNLAIHAAAWCVAGDLGYLSRGPDAGEAPFARALSLLQSGSIPPSIAAIIRADASIGLSLAARTAGALPLALLRCRDAIQCAEATGDSWRLARAWSEYGLILRDQQAADDAARALRTALAHFLEAGDRIYALLVRTELAELLHHFGPSDDAMTLFRDVLGEAIERHATYLEIRCRLALTGDALRRGAIDEARVQLPAAAALLGQSGDDWQRLSLADQYVRFAIATDDAPTARRWASARLALASRIAIPPPVWIYVLGSAASVTAAFGPASCGAQLYGWIETERSRLGLCTLTAPEQQVYTHDRERLADALGKGLPDELKRGAELTRDDAIGLALDALGAAPHDWV